MKKTSTQQHLLYCFVVAFVIGLIVVTLLAYMRSHTGQLAPIKSMKSWQHANAPLGHPLLDGSTPAFDPRFIQLSAFDRNLLPIATTMMQPMGSRHGALTYNAQPFWANNKQRGGYHTGDDINGIGGMDSDLGDPVFAAANGIVIYRGEPSHGWGNTLILAHRSADGDIHQLMYAHLQKSSVAVGELVAMGEKIGTVGNANGNYPAHLHLELRHTSGVWIGSGYVQEGTEHLNPDLVINKYSKKPTEMLNIAPLLSVKYDQLEKARANMMINNNAQ